MNGFTVVIPARMASSRLPGKPLADIAGKPMVVRVAEQAARSHASRVIVATDHAEIIAACAAHGVEAVLTRADHHHHPVDCRMRRQRRMAVRDHRPPSDRGELLGAILTRSLAAPGSDDQRDGGSAFHSDSE